MSRSEFTASANVRVVVEVQGMGPYGEDWKASDMHDQVAQEAINKVKQAFGVCASCAKQRAHGRFQIVGEPKVEIVMARRTK